MESIIRDIKQIKKKLQEKDKYLLKRLVQGAYEDLLRLMFKFIPNKGQRILDQKWEYLIVLDACRFDVFKELNTIKGNQKKIKSLGSSTIAGLLTILKDQAIMTSSTFWQIQC